MHPARLAALLVAAPLLVASPGEAAARPPVWAYEVRPIDGGALLRIEAAFPAGIDAHLTVDEGAVPFVRDVTVSAAGGPFVPLALVSGEWSAPACLAHGCRVRYAFALAEAARALAELDQALRIPAGYEAPPSLWLLRPREGDEATRVRFRVVESAGARFVCGVRPVPSEPAMFEATVGDLPLVPYSAFGEFDVRVLQPARGGEVVLAMPRDAGFAVDLQTLERSVARAAAAVSAYFGQLPVPRVLVLVLPSGQVGGIGGRTLGGGGATVVLTLGREVDAARLEADWVLAHEFIHLGAPHLPRSDAWFGEGLATYLEPIARARVGHLPPEKVWADLVEGLPKGARALAQSGLEEGQGWAGTYWGGALFWLLADVEIRTRTGNRQSLDTAARGILSGGGDVSARWDLSRAVRAGDRSLAFPALAGLRARLGPQPAAIDLDDLWRRLGIVRSGDTVVFDEAAPLAAVRRAVTAAAPAGPARSRP